MNGERKSFCNRVRKLEGEVSGKEFHRDRCIEECAAGLVGPSIGDAQERSIDRGAPVEHEIASSEAIAEIDGRVAVCASDTCSGKHCNVRTFVAFFAIL